MNALAKELRAAEGRLDLWHLVVQVDSETGDSETHCD